MDTRDFIPAEHAAEQLGVPAAWLKAQGKAGDIPSIETGTRRLFNVEQVRGVLLNRAASVRNRESVGAA